MSFFKKTVAEREKVKLMLGLAGIAGSGKTYSALQLAYGITGDWTKIALADTENKSSLYYAGDRTGPWQHIDFPSSIMIEGKKGYHPDNWVALIKEAEKDPNISVLILDSISHEWQGTGGSLEAVDVAGGNKFTSGWKDVTPRHNRFFDKMRESRLHIIATMRRVADYQIETNDRGKSVPKKVGLKSIQREGTDYEFGLIFDIDISHLATASKDRTGLYLERGHFLITEDTGKELLKWANEGKEAPPNLEFQAKVLAFVKSKHIDTEYFVQRFFEHAVKAFSEATEADRAIVMNIISEIEETDHE